MTFLARVARGQLLASLAHTTRPELARLVEWLIQVTQGGRPSGDPADDIGRRMADPDRLTRLVGAAAAARYAAVDRAPLDAAARSGDDEVRDFVQSESDFLSTRNQVRASRRTKE
jgi:hypothetical protein